MKEKLLVSFSGGRTSAYMSWWLNMNMRDKYEMIFVFANTGDEMEETLVFVDQCDKAFGWNIVWVECVTNPTRGEGVSAKVVDFNTAARNGEPFEAMIAKHGIPSVASPHCSRELKGYTIKSYAKSIRWKDYKTAIGIRYDELARVDWDKAKRLNLTYPLADIHKCFRFDINMFWSRQSFDLNLKSYEGNCKACYKKSLRKLMTIAVEHPERFDFNRRMEKTYENFVPVGKQNNPKLKPPLRFYRENMSVDDVFRQSTFQFSKARDESKETNILLTMQDWSAEMDTNAGCVESCEAFGDIEIEETVD